MTILSSEVKAHEDFVTSPKLQLQYSNLFTYNDQVGVINYLIFPLV